MNSEPLYLPEKGRMLIAAVIEKDGSEFILVAAHDIVCKGDVQVAAGGRFRMEKHVLLPLGEYVGLGNVCMVSTEFVEKMWNWSVRLTAAQKTLLEKNRQAALAARDEMPEQAAGDDSIPF